MLSRCLLRRFKVSLVEVGPRDGLQNEPKSIDVATKREFIKKLEQSGLKHIEVGAFVSPKWVPQMASSEELITKLVAENPKFDYSALVPNENGMLSAIKSGLKQISVFTAVSETFSQKNTNCSVEESLDRISKVIKLAKENDIQVAR
jgi:hydroxymethylglutaryl-CoA lyase